MIRFFGPVVGLVVWFAVGSGCSDRSDDGPPLLFPSASALPDSFVIQNDSLDCHAIPRSGALWMTRPIEDWADVQRTGTLLQIARAGFRVRTVSDEGDNWKEFGLDPPQAIVRVGNESLALGHSNPTRDGVFARCPATDPRLILVGTPFASFTSLTLDQIRDRHALRFPIRDLHEIRIRDEDGVRSAKRNDERWAYQEGGVRADGKSIWRIAFHLLDGTIHSFGDPKATLLDTVMVLGLSWGEEGAGQVSFGAPVTGTALVSASSSDRPGVFYLPYRILDSIEVHATPLFDAQLFQTSAMRAGVVALQDAAGSMRLVRDDDGWRRDTAKGPALPGSAVRAFLRNLDSIRLEGVVPSPIAAAFQPSGWQIEVEGDVVSVDESNDGVVLLRRDGESGVLSLAPDRWAALRAQAADLLQAKERPGR